MMREELQQQLEEETTALQAHLSLLEETGGPARAAAQHMMQSVLGLHRSGLAELLAIVRAAGSQPADILLPRFAANPKVRSLLLLHDLHPQDLAARVTEAVERLRSHLGVRDIRAAVKSVDSDTGAVCIRVTGAPSGAAGRWVRREVENALMELAPEIQQLDIDGIDEGDGQREVPLVWAPQERT